MKNYKYSLHVILSITSFFLLSLSPRQALEIQELKTKGIIQQPELSVWCVENPGGWALEVRYQGKIGQSAIVPLAADLESRERCLDADRQFGLKKIGVESEYLLAIELADGSRRIVPLLIPGYSDLELERVPGFTCLDPRVDN